MLSWLANALCLFGLLSAEYHRSLVLFPHEVQEMWRFDDLLIASQVVEQKLEFPMIWNAMTLVWRHCDAISHYNDAIMIVMASQITSLTIVYSTVYSGTDGRKHQRSASLAFVRGIHRWPVNSPHKGPVTRKMFPFDDVIMSYRRKLKCTGVYQFTDNTDMFKKQRVEAIKINDPVSPTWTHWGMVAHTYSVPLLTHCWFDP